MDTDKLGQIVEQVAVALFARPQCLFRLLLLGDVEQGRGEGWLPVKHETLDRQ